MRPMLIPKPTLEERRKEFFERINRFLSRRIFLGLGLIFLFLALLIFAPIRGESIAERLGWIKSVKDGQESLAAVPNLTIDYFKRSYAVMKRYLIYTKRVGVMGGQAVISEFDDNNKQYAGHLGAFWSPPFYSSHIKPYTDNSNEWLNGFNVGLVLFDRNSGGSATEASSNPQTEAFWYPSKLKVWKTYPGDGPGHKVTGVKTAIPGYRALGLKLTYQNLGTSRPSNQNVLFLITSKTLNRITNWNWHPGPSADTNLNADYNSANKMIIIKNQANNTFVGIGLSGYLDSWQTHTDRVVIYNNFRTATPGRLPNGDGDGFTPTGTAAGLVARLPTMNPGDVKTVTLLITIGGTKNEVINTFNALKAQDIEALADNFWNAKLSDLFAKIPHPENVSADFAKIYYNSWLNLLLNKWEFSSNDSYVNDKSFYSLSGLLGQSMAQFPWSTLNFGQGLAIYDPASLKDLIKDYIRLNVEKCRAYNPINNGAHLCDVRYSFDPVSIVQLIYDYVAVTSDAAFLNERVTQGTATRTTIDWAKYYAEDGDRRAWGSSRRLADYGNDRNLFEYNIHCNLGGQYVGKVPAPNAERYLAFIQLADLYARRGDTANKNRYLTKANDVKTALSTLWDASNGWFRRSPGKSPFWGIQILPLLGYNGLLTDSQKTFIYNHLPEFKNPANNYGYTSLPYSPRRHTWCSRPDWHGPGLYSGEVGLLFTSLFKAGYKEEVYAEMFAPGGKGYQYLKDIPYWSQSFRYDSYAMPGNVSGSNVAYIDGSSIAQAFVKGLFGFEPQATITKIAPNIPSAQNNAYLTNVRLQGHIFTLRVNGSNHYLAMRIDADSSRPADHTRFRFKGTGTLNATISHLIASRKYTVQVKRATDSSTVSTFTATSNWQGGLSFSYPLAGEYDFYINLK